MADAGSLWVRLGLKDAQFRKGLDKAEARTKRFSGTVSKLGGVMSAAIGVVGVMAVMRLGKQFVTLQAEFSKTMSRVFALTDATDEMSKVLTNQAQILGQQTVFTAREAGSAMQFLAQAGLDTQQIYQALPNTLELAAAGQIELAEAADIATNVMSAYGLQAEELGRVNDIITNTTTKSNTNVIEFAEAFKMVGPIAKSAGMSMEDVAASIGILGNAGIKGTMAGTQLRAMLAKLINPTGDAAKVLKDLGIKTIDPLTGNMRRLNDIMADMKTAGIKLSDVFEVFDNRAAAAALVLEGASDTFEDFVEVVGRSGTATRIAAEQLDNLAGDLKIVQSAWEGMLLAAGQGSDGFMRAIAQMVSGALNFVTAEQQISEQLRETQTAMNAELDALKSGNLEGEARVILISDINRKYKDYLPNLITEKDSINDIETAQWAANRALEKRIELRAQEEILSRDALKVAELRADVTKAAIALEEEKNEGISLSLAGIAAAEVKHEKLIKIKEKAVERLKGKYEEANKAYKEFLKEFTEAPIPPGIDEVKVDEVDGGEDNIEKRMKKRAAAISLAADAQLKLNEINRLAAKIDLDEWDSPISNEFLNEIIEATKGLEDFKTQGKVAEEWMESAEFVSPISDEWIEQMIEASEVQIDLKESIEDYGEALDISRMQVSEFAAVHKQAFETAESVAKQWSESIVEATVMSGAGLEDYANSLRRMVKQTISAYIASAVVAMVAGAIKDTATKIPFGFLIAPAVGALAAAAANSLFDKIVPSFGGGIDYVPYDMPANLHEGERVLTQTENLKYGDSGGGGNVGYIADLRFEMRDFVIEFRKEEKRMGRA